MDPQVIAEIVHEPEVLPAKQPSLQHINGRFAPGNLGRRQGALDTITRQMREELAARMKDDPKTNPLVFFTDVMVNEKNDMAHRLNAAKFLAGFILPKTYVIQDETEPGELIAARQRVTESLKLYFAKEKPLAAD